MVLNSRGDRTADRRLLFFYSGGMTTMLVALPSAEALFSSIGEMMGKKARLIRKLAMTAGAAIALAATIGCGPARAQDPDITSRRAAERTDFTNDEIRDG